MPDDRELRNLLRDIENEAVDKNDWLKRKEIEAIMEERKKRPQHATIADHLIKKGFLDLRHRDYGLDYLELRNAVYGNLDAKTLGLFFRDGSNYRDGTLKKSNAARVYEMVSRGVGREAEHFIETCLNTLAQHVSLTHAFVCNVYRLAFESLEEEIDRALKIISEEEQKALAQERQPQYNGGEYAPLVRPKFEPVSGN